MKSVRPTWGCGAVVWRRAHSVEVWIISSSLFETKPSMSSEKCFSDARVPHLPPAGALHDGRRGRAGAASAAERRAGLTGRPPRSSAVTALRRGLRPQVAAGRPPKTAGAHGCRRQGGGRAANDDRVVERERPADSGGRGRRLRHSAPGAAFEGSSQAIAHLPNPDGPSGGRRLPWHQGETHGESRRHLPATWTTESVGYKRV
eukprot:147117-Chlamydomonas_euryale.AAC.2